MLERYFVRPQTVDRIRAGWIGSEIERYVVWLAEHGYSSRSVLHAGAAADRVRGVRARARRANGRGAAGARRGVRGRVDGRSTGRLAKAGDRSRRRCAARSSRC